MVKKLKTPAKIRCFGKIVKKGSITYMFHPTIEFITNKNTLLNKTLTPIYPLTAGISQNQISNWIREQLTALDKSPLPELLNDEAIALFRLESLEQSLKHIHSPRPQDVYESQVTGNLVLKPNNKSLQRFIAEELIAWGIGFLINKSEQAKSTAIPLRYDSELDTQWRSLLPFELTLDQVKSIKEIMQDVAQDKPMMRVLQGDVGCGKTLVAIGTMIQFAKQNIQSVLLAPTEILAEQHAITLINQLTPLGLTVVHLSGSLTSKQRSERLSLIASGTATVIVGTHAVFAESVEYQRLGYVVIDEQQRFGVEQRKKLQDKQKGSQHYPHQLIMSATPIPRTLALIVFSDLPISTMTQYPSDRRKITTATIDNQRRDEVVARVKKQLSEGRQAYWVCPLIDSNDDLAAEAVLDLAQLLEPKLGGISIAAVHGRMPDQQRQEIMREFRANKIQLLIATTVIEVGVDVPNASIMVIENSERLGLSQLHQLRGRVGRGAIESYCLLLYQNPLTDIAMQRLETMKTQNDGFIIANKDLELRGSGELFGTKQSGMADFKVVRFPRDIPTFEKVKNIAKKLHENDPEKARELYDRWNSAIPINQI